MATEIKAPVFPESVADGTVASWHKKVGEPVTRDEVLADIETDKVVLEVVAPSDGVLTQILKNEGDTVLSAEVLALFEAGSSKAASQQAVEPGKPVEQASASAEARCGRGAGAPAGPAQRACTREAMRASTLARRACRTTRSH